MNYPDSWLTSHKQSSAKVVDYIQSHRIDSKLNCMWQLSTMTYAKNMRAAQEYVVKERPENIGDAADELSPGTSAF